MSHSPITMLQPSQLHPETGTVRPIYIKESPQMGHNTSSRSEGVQMVQFGYPGSRLTGTGMAQLVVFEGNDPTGDVRGSAPQTGSEVFSGIEPDEMVTKTNPFLF